MKFKYGTLILLFLLAVCLSGCNCEHQWKPADCVHPAECAACGETGDGALGHAWLDATCEQPQTCSRCGDTQGDTIEHNYGEWTFGQEEMTRQCSVCSYTDTAEIDRERYLESLLPGYWDFFGMYNGDEYIEGSRVKISGLLFHFGEGRTAEFSTPLLGEQSVVWSFDEYRHESGADSYYFTLTGETETYSMCLRHDPTGALNQPPKELVLLSSEQLLMFAQYDKLDRKLVGDWGIQYQWGQPVGNPGNWITFRPDRTVVGVMNGEVKGTWYAIPVYSPGDWKNPNKYVVMIENKSDAEHPLYVGWLEMSDGNVLRMEIGESYQSFEQVRPAALEQIQISNSIHLGTWTSTEIMYHGDTERETDEYSVTFHPDGTFTADVGRKLDGYWILRDIVDAGDKDWTNGNDAPVYNYFMYAEGLEKIYCEVDARGDKNTFIIHNCQWLDGRTIEFLQRSEEELALNKQRYTYPIGTWTCRSYYVDNRLNNTREEDVQRENHSFTFHEDGTCSVVLDKEYTGTWTFESLDYQETSTGDYWEFYYIVTLADLSNVLGIHIEHRAVPEFWVYIPHPEKEDHEITACFDRR